MVSTATKRRAVRESVENAVASTAQACRALGLARSSYYRNPKVSETQRQLHAYIVQLNLDHSRLDYRSITALLRCEGLRINPKRVQRLKHEHELQTLKCQRRMKRVGP